MPDISIAAEGIDKLLVGVNPYKAEGPDKFKPIVPQTLHKELAPILQLIIYILSFVSPVSSCFTQYCVAYTWGIVLIGYALIRVGASCLLNMGRVVL